MGKHLQYILSVMCKRVGVDFNDIDFQKEDWFMDYSWTVSEQDNFQRWLEGYLEGSKEAREEIMQFPRKNKKDIKKVASTFVSIYGWKCEE